MSLSSDCCTVDSTRGCLWSVARSGSVSVCCFRCRLPSEEAIMLGSIGRAWRSWRAKSDLIAPIWHFPPGWSFTHFLQSPELAAVLKAGGPELQPYEGMAAVWDEYGSYQLPRYP